MTVVQIPVRTATRLPLVELVMRESDLQPGRSGWLQAQREDALRVGPERLVVDLAAPCSSCGGCARGCPGSSA